jgi:hypothetical protein
MFLHSIKVIIICSNVRFYSNNFPKSRLVLYHFEIKSLRVVIVLHVIADFSVE